MESNAEISADGLYRYALLRRWSDDPLVRWIMLNPSTADAVQNDATIRRCMGFARAWGRGGILVHNLFAYRSTDPAALPEAAQAGIDIVGPLNDDHLRGVDPDAITVCAWGTNGALYDRGAEVLAILAETGIPAHCLGLTMAGHPKHPVRLAGNTPLIPVPGGVTP